MKTLKLASLVVLVSAVAALITATIVPGSKETVSSLHGEQRHVFLGFAHAGDAVVAVGEQGQIWRSTDGGESWSNRPSGTDRLLTAVDFANDSVGLAVGHFGTVLHSNDGGKSWQQVPLDLDSAQQFAALDVAFVDDQNAYIVGSAGRILRTRDGGLSWQDDMRSSSAQANLNAIRILPSGRAMVVASDGSIFIQSAQGEDRAWELLPEQTRQPLFGIVQMGSDDAVLVIGAEGTILQSDDGGASWDIQKSASKATYYTGIRRADGSVILAGDQGIMVRRAPGLNGFYLEETLPQDAVVDLTETPNGTLLLAGVQGLGRFADSEYQFVGDDDGLTGHWRTRELQQLPETRFLLAHTAEQAYYDEDPDMAEDVDQDWHIVDLVARNGGSLLEPSLFSEIRHIYLQLHSDAAFSAYSLWSSELLVPSVNGEATSLMSYVNQDYDEMDSAALLQRIQRASVEGLLISKDHSRISFYVEPKADPVAREFVPIYLEDLKGTYNRSLESGYEVQLSRLLNLRSAPPTAAHADENAYFVYVLAVRGSSYRSCDFAPYAELAHKLDASLRGLDAIQTSLSFAEIHKWNNVLEHGSWKWFSTGTTDDQRSQGNYGHWASYRCVNTVAIVYGEKAGRNASDEIMGVIEAIAEPELAAQIAVTPYLMTAAALP